MDPDVALFIGSQIGAGRMEKKKYTPYGNVYIFSAARNDLIADVYYIMADVKMQINRR